MIPAHHVDFWSTGSAANISSQSSLLCCFCWILLQQQVSSATAVRTKVAIIPSQTGRRAGWGSPKQSQSRFPVTRAFPQWMKRSLPWSVGGSAARGVCDEAVAEAPGPPRVPALVLPACFACKHAWRFRWQPAREAPVRMTVKQSRHPHGRLSPTI
ncbi:hypothetical protein TcG_11815 [Trypanosoma cruzi]|nr:hypothetical protein TcG_11815 [Trypanosoma cruzi]